MMKTIHASLCCVCVAAVMAVVTSAQGTDRTIRTVYISAGDGEGVPILDLTAADIAVREGGRDREVIRTERATEPMQVAVVIDDNGRGFFQAAVAQLVAKLEGHAELAIITVNGFPTRLVDYTTNVDALRNAIARLGVRAGSPGDGQVLEALMDLGRTWRERKVARPVIVVFTISGGSASLPSGGVVEQLKSGGALLHVVGTKLARPIAPPWNGHTDAADFELSRAYVDGARQSGGRVQEFTDDRGIDQAVARIADELLNQYVISYALPGGVRPDERVDVSAKRRGVSLRAPSRIPVN